MDNPKGHYLLNVKILPKYTVEMEDKIKEEVLKYIKGVCITKVIRGVNVAITWNSDDDINYYAEVKSFTDIAVKLHSKLLIIDIKDKFEKKITGLSFIISKKPITLIN